MPQPPAMSTPPPTLAGSSGSARSLAAAGRPAAWQLQAGGVLLFLFIPLVLYLFVRHPAPLAASLAAGILLMVSHRFLARPYMVRVLPCKCLWCNRVLPPVLDPATRTLDLAAGGEVLAARCCAGHRSQAVRFLGFLERARWPLRLGIFLPLLLLLAALAAAAVLGTHGTPALDTTGGAVGAAAAAGAAARFPLLPSATALFQLLVGLTVSAAAWGYLLGARREPAAPVAVPFPAHNFFLLGLRILLWIFRLVGAWWIVAGARYFLR
jgi:hypothetical protein